MFQKSIDLLKPYFKQASHHLYILTVQNHVVMLHALMDRLFHACSSVSITPSRASYTRAYHPSFLHVAKIFSITMEQQAWVKTFKYSKNKHRVIISAREDTFSRMCAQEIRLINLYIKLLWTRTNLLHLLLLFTNKSSPRWIQRILSNLSFDLCDHHWRRKENKGRWKRIKRERWRSKEEGRRRQVEGSDEMPRKLEQWQEKRRTHLF